MGSKNQIGGDKSPIRALRGASPCFGCSCHHEIHAPKFRAFSAETDTIR